MNESIALEKGAPKKVKYEQLIPQLEALVGSEKNVVAVLSNVSAALHQSFNFFWTGFYIIEADELILGPFQGPVACLRISLGQGVCGTAVAENDTIIVADVDRFPGHISCNPLSKSEIVVPIRDKSGAVCAVLDVDSATLATFDAIDREYLEQICNWLGEAIF